MGFSYGDGNHDEIGRVALLNLNLAEVRGGDQAVVKENNDNMNPIFFGGGTASAVKRTRTRTRAMMAAISDKIKSVDQVFVVGHKNLDMDAWVLLLVCSSLLVISLRKLMWSMIRPRWLLTLSAPLQSSSRKADYLVPLSEAVNMVTNRSLLIMVDHSKISLTLSKDFFDQFSQIIVVDHHRRDEDFPENAVIAYIESGASNASELVTELIQFQNSKRTVSARCKPAFSWRGLCLTPKDFHLESPVGPLMYVSAIYELGQYCCCDPGHFSYEF